MFSAGQNVIWSDPRSGERHDGQVWGDSAGNNVVNVPSLNRCILASDESLESR